MLTFEGDAAPPVQPTPIPELMSIADMAARFGKTDRTIRRWITRGIIVPVRVGRSLFVRVDDVVAIISGRITDRVMAGR